MIWLTFVILILCVFSNASGAAIKNNTSIMISLDLRGCDPFSACDASVTLTILCSSIYSDWKICENTKKIQNNNNPVWPEIFTFEHEPGSGQRWRLDLKDHDLGGTKLIASFNVNVDEFGQKEGNLLQNDIPENRGTLWVERHAN